MTLREQLRLRLVEVGNAADQTDDFMHNHHRAMPSIADEVIRLMEWARRECIVNDEPQSMGGPGGGSVRPSDYENAPISLWDDVAKRSLPAITVEDPRHPNHGGKRWPPALSLPPLDWKP